MATTAPQIVDWIDGSKIHVFDLEAPRFQGMPIHEAHEPGYMYVLHRRHSDGYRPGGSERRSSASGVIVCMEHSGTHIDAISHQSDAQILYGGANANDVSNSKGFSQGGVEEIAPIIAPGVLLDVPRFRGVDEVPAGDAIDAAELQACAAAQGVSIQPGNVVLVRTGNGRHWNQPKRYPRGVRG